MVSSDMDTMDALYESLQRRMRPEDVAELVLDALGSDLGLLDRRRIQEVARGSLRQGLYQVTSMSQDFHRPVPPERQARRAEQLFVTASGHALSAEDCTRPEVVLAFIRRISLEIDKTLGESSFKHHRMNREQRKAAGLEHSKRRYNKLFRFLHRFERKLATYQLEQRKYGATRIAKARLATHIDRCDFDASREAACFVAYYAARCNRRSVFTNKSQDRPFDGLSKMLLDRFKQAPTPGGWRAIARVMPDLDVVENLSEEDKVALCGTWLSVLREIADLLAVTWKRSRFDRSSMIVARGDDSSTWNALAGAWNAARQGWLGLANALGMDQMVDAPCFGKVMRLMAADVAVWHRQSGGHVDPDTLVWAELPPPWEVFRGTETCTRSQIELVCAKYGVDPEKRGWTSPPSSRRAVAFYPTAELVHGVVVDHPELATVLRQAGWFSGKAPRPMDIEQQPFAVMRAKAGAPLGMTRSTTPVPVDVEDPTNETDLAPK